MLVSVAGRLDLPPWSVGGHAAGPVATLAPLPSHCERADSRGWLTWSRYLMSSGTHCLASSLVDAPGRGLSAAPWKSSHIMPCLKPDLRLAGLLIFLLQVLERPIQPLAGVRGSVRLQTSRWCVFRVTRMPGSSPDRSSVLWGIAPTTPLSDRPWKSHTGLCELPPGTYSLLGHWLWSPEPW